MPAALRQKVRRRSSFARAKGSTGGRSLFTSQQRLRTLPLPFLTEETSSVAGQPTADDGSLDTTCKTSQAALEQASDQRPTPSAAVGSPSVASSAQQALVAQLAREVQRIEVGGRPVATAGGKASTVFSTGCAVMDDCLPSGGYDSGTVVEYLQTSSASGATSLALTAAREALATTDRFCVLVDWRQQFYPPAAAALGIDLKRVVIVRPRTLAERLWAIDQALRSPAVVAVIAEVEHMDDRAARRLQLAAECGGGVGLLVRGEAARQHPSWAEVQWLVRPLAERSAHRQLELQLMRARGGRSGTQLRVQINATHGRIEATPAATAALARTLAQPRPPAAQHQRERSA